jgi:hypothetical protein
MILILIIRWNLSKHHTNAPCIELLEPLSSSTEMNASLVVN